MTIDQPVEEVAEVPEDEWVDTEAQAQLRQCLLQILAGHDDITTIVIAGELIAVMRDQLMGHAAMVRRSAARAARTAGIMPEELARATRQTKATVARLLTESRP